MFGERGLGEIESGASSITGIKSAEYSHLKSNLSPLSVGASRILNSPGEQRPSARSPQMVSMRI